MDVQTKVEDQSEKEKGKFVDQSCLKSNGISTQVDIIVDLNIFEITKNKLGAGNFGKVFIAIEKETNKKYAAKILQPDNLQDASNQNNLLREVLILHNLKHNAIIKFRGFNFNLKRKENEVTIKPIIFTEYYQNGSLKSLLDMEQKGLSNEKWNNTYKHIVLLGIADALRYLHKKGIVHRDLKPENVLIDDENYPHICDFGLSRTFVNDVSMTSNLGTPLYIAPEILGGKKHYGTEIDIYSFGLIAYELASGNRVEDELPKQLYQLMGKIMNGFRPKIPSFVSPKMKDLIKRCWDENPMERPDQEEIYEIFSTDFSLLDDVDPNEVEKYLDFLKSMSDTEETTIEKFTPDNDDSNSEKYIKEIKRLQNINACYEKQIEDLKEKNKSLNNQVLLLGQKSAKKSDNESSKEKISEVPEKEKKTHHHHHHRKTSDKNETKEKKKNDKEIKKAQLDVLIAAAKSSMKNSAAAAGASTQAALQSMNSAEDKSVARTAANAALACQRESELACDIINAAFSEETSKEKVEELLERARKTSRNSLNASSIAAKAAEVVGLPQWSLLTLGAASAAANLDSKKNKWKHLLALQENNEESAKKYLSQHQKSQKFADNLELQILSSSALQEMESDSNSD